MRLFISIQFDDDIRKRILKVLNDCRSAGVRGRFSRDEDIHLTLAFIGGYNNPQFVLDAMEMVQFEPFDIEFDRLGSFGDILWLGTKENRQLERLADAVRRELAADGIPYDIKKFRPHITLARDASGIEKTAGKVFIPKEKATVKRISLMQSTRRNNGMIYTELGCVFANFQADA